MAKKLKVNLEGIKVRSFLTSLKDDEKNDIKGGTGFTNPWDYMCNSHIECIESWHLDCEDPPDPE
jgi:hypothetical protein